jgi:hypothetical protein
MRPTVANVQLIGILLLMTVAIVAAYFYLKRIERRRISDSTSQPSEQPGSDQNSAP